MTRVALAGSLSLALATGPLPAYADDKDEDRRGRGRTCPPKWVYRVDDLSPRNFWIPRTRFIDGPGGTVTASVSRQWRVYSEVEIENEPIWARERERHEKHKTIDQFRRMVNPLLVEEHIVTAGHEYTHEITAGKYGNLWYRVFGYRIGFSAWRQLGTCHRHKVTHGVANVPARVEGWKYWETATPEFEAKKKDDKEKDEDES